MRHSRFFKTYHKYKLTHTIVIMYMLVELMHGQNLMPIKYLIFHEYLFLGLKK